MSEIGRASEELKMDQVIKMIRKIATDIGSFPQNDLLKRINYQLVADPYDLYDFLMCVEELNDYRKKLEGPDVVSDDQLSLF